MELDQQRKPRRTKIIFTIGPATDSEEMLEKLMSEYFVDVCRINMAHANHDYVRTVARRIHQIGEKLNRPISIMMDVKGPEIRTGDVDHPIILEADEIFDFTVKPDATNSEEIRSVGVNYANLVNDIEVGSTVLVDNGLIQFEVLEIDSARIRCKVIIPGELTSRRHINLPGVKISLPPLTEKDKGDTLVGIEEGIDLFALSFVREENDLTILRNFLDENDGHNARIIAKIEDQTAISNLDSIIQEADGLMVARGDLGIECPFEMLPIIQHRAVKTCLTHGKPVIIATHMLESMISNPMPTRAEVSDVAIAVEEEADCVMLSGETTIGKYPLECVDALTKISKAIDQHGKKFSFAKELILTNDKARIQHTAVIMANELEAVAILCFTRSGSMARGVSAQRPRTSPIFAFTNSTDTVRQLRLHHGVTPFQMIFCTEPEATVARSMKQLVKRGYLKKGDKIVLVSDILASDRVIDSVQLRTVD
ncbi:MAG: pyruvate kinase [Opitutaceae bacterium]|nr:pyruvate kinase [Opitutaceae bacterium]